MTSGQRGEIGDARTARSGSRWPRLVDGYTSRTVRCIPVFVRSEKSNALVGGGVPRFHRAGQLTLLTLYGCAELAQSDSKIGSCTWRNFHFRPPGLTPLEVDYRPRQVLAHPPTLLDLPDDTSGPAST